MKFNDLDIKKWKESDINVDSLWLINERDKRGKHSNKYHGNFIPQIPYQLIKRYTKKQDIVLDMFLGSGTTLFECENLKRNFIGLDINEDIITFVEDKMEQSSKINFDIQNCDTSNPTDFDNKIKKSLNKLNSKRVQFVIMHPPYLDIVKFTNKNEDLSQISDLTQFVKIFNKVVQNALNYLETNRYFAIVIGDVYKKGKVIPLSFYVMDAIKRNFKVKLKGIVVKNIEGNRGKLGKGGIWKYRALNSDYYIFKHEYIMVFKKEF